MENPNKPEFYNKLYDGIWEINDYSQPYEYEETARIDFYNQLVQLPFFDGPGKILDVGCGMGGVFCTFPQGSKLTKFGIDFSHVAIEKISSRIPDGTFVVGDVHNLPFENDYFQRVTCTETLEHVDSPFSVVAEMFRVLQNNGKLLITVPEKTFDLPAESWPGGISVHINKFSVESLSAIVRENGFGIDSAEIIEGVIWLIASKPESTGKCRRTKVRYALSEVNADIQVARKLFGQGSHIEAFDCYEQLAEAYPIHAIDILAEALDQYKSLPAEHTRYHLYQARHFDFGIRPSDKVLDIGSGHLPFPFATHLADLALEDGNVGRAGIPFKHLDGKPVYECNIEKLPFADKEFDFVYCSHVLEHVNSPENACQELMRVAKRGYIETPTRGKDLWLNTAKISNHRWAVELIHQKLVFTEYTLQEIDGVNCDILLNMHCSPRTLREKAFAALLYLKADLVNTMVYWEDTFELEVRRIKGSRPDSAAPPISKSPLTPRTEPSFSAPIYKQLRFMQVLTFYDQYLTDFYQKYPKLAASSYNDQIEALMADGFGAIHTYAPYLKEIGYQPLFILANCAQTQACWLQEQSLPFPTASWQKEIVRMQVERFQPDVLYLGNPIEFDASFVASLSWRPPLIIGWRAASIPPGTDMSHMDIMLSHLSVSRQQVLKLGARNAEHFVPGVPAFLAQATNDQPKLYDVVFSGQWTSEHATRNTLIERVAKAAQQRGFSLGLFLACADPGQLPYDVAKYNLGARWGLDMYRALKSGRIVINAEIDLAQGEAGNMRLFEATSVGSFLLTEHHLNIESYFRPGDQIETFHDSDELLQKIDYYLSHPEERELIARMGQEHSLKEHGMQRRVLLLDQIIKKYLAAPSVRSPLAEEPYDTAYRWGWNHPQLKELVYLCYKTPDFANNARRYYNSQEFHEVLSMFVELGHSATALEKVLDIGCGNGIASYSLARSGYDVIGIDSSLGELAGIRAAEKLQGLDEVQFEVRHVSSHFLEFPNESFDIVWMREVLHHIDDLVSFLCEVKRVLKPGGILCCLRDVVIWNEEQRVHFFENHPFYHITHDEGCFFLKEYHYAFEAAGFFLEKELNPLESVINTYPAKPALGVIFDPAVSAARAAGYDLFSFILRKPVSCADEIKTADAVMKCFLALQKQKEEMMQTALKCPPVSVTISPLVPTSLRLDPSDLEGSFPGVSFGDHVQVLGITNIAIGEGSCIGSSSWLNVCTRDERIRLRIGNCVLVGRQAVISTGGILEIGDFCVFAPRVYISDADHIYSDIMQPILQQGATINRSVIVEENCWLGINTVISGNLTVGRGSVVGANAVVTHDVPPFSVVVGNPSQIVKMYSPRTGTWERTRSNEDIQRILEERRERGIPSREEYQNILKQNARLSQLDPVLAGRGNL
ncbi:MAG: methyltransferase domain-containing protein [Desulfuromonadaceae bacterium]